MKLLRRIFVPDSHWPDCDIKSFDLMLDVMRDFRPHEVVVLGDFFDCATVSQYTKDPKSQYKLLEEELEPGRRAIQRIMNAAPNASYVFLAGNHESRIDRYVAANASALGGSISTQEVLRLPKQWKFISYGHNGFYRCGPKLIATHGTVFNRHVCMSMVQKYGCSVVHGHVHRVQEFHVRNVHGDDLVGFTPGWLGDMDKIGYIQDIADWSHGFALAWFKPNGDFYHQIIPIKNHSLIFNGNYRWR